MCLNRLSISYFIIKRVALHFVSDTLFAYTFTSDICVIKYGSHYGWIGTSELRQCCKITKYKMQLCIAKLSRLSH